MKSPALLTGPYDWDPTLLPRNEFEARLAMMRSVMTMRGVNGLVVCGDSAEHGALAYLTGFTPKLGPAFALVPMEGPVRLLVSGSPNMSSAAKRLTWVEDLRALGDPRKSLEQGMRALKGRESGQLGLWSSRAMTRRLRLLSGGLVDLDDALDALRRHKSQIERKMIVQACQSLSMAHEVFARAVVKGAGARTAAIQAERAAFHAGAQDFRILGSARDGGPPLPFYGTADLVVSPILMCMAVRFAGYWAEGLATIGGVGGSAGVRAGADLGLMIEAAHAGVTFHGLAEVARVSVKLAPCSSIGLSLDEPSDSLEDGGVYTLRASAGWGDCDNAIVSAMIAVNGGAVEILWRGATQ